MDGLDEMSSSTPPTTMVVRMREDTTPGRYAEAPWRHPLLLDQTREPDPYGGPAELVFTFKVFPRTRVQPELPPESLSWTKPQRRSAEREVDAARSAWAMSQHLLRLQALIEDARPAATAFVVAYKELQAAWAAVDDAPDRRWRATVTRLVRAQEAALEAGRGWFALRVEMEDEQWTHGERVLEAVGDWRDVAAKMGIDVSMWVQCDSLTDLHEEIERQRRTVKQASELTDGDAGDKGWGMPW